MDTARVLHFLQRCGFDRAADAFLDDVLARGALGLSTEEDEEEIVVVLPPVKTGDNAGSRFARSSSGDDDAFVSVGSSPAGPIVQHEVRHAGSISSDAQSEFCTARAHNGGNAFSDANWCDERSGGGAKDLYLTLLEDIDVECEDCVKVNGCGGMKELCNGDSSGLISGASESRESMSCLKLAGEVPGSDYWEVDLQCFNNGSGSVTGNLNLKLSDEDLHMLGITELNGLEEVDTDCDFPSEEREYSNTNHQIKNRLVIDADGIGSSSDADLFVSKRSLKEDANGASELNVDQNINMGTIEQELGRHLRDEQDAADGLRTLDGQEDEYEIFELRVVHRKNRTGFEESRDLPIILNSLIAGRYYATEFLGSAAFSRVVQAHDLHTGIDVCLKIIKNDKDFFDQSLDEIKLLKFVNKHDPSDEYHLLRLYDYFYHQEHLFIVCELLKANLYEFQKYNQESDGEMYFTLPRIQAIARQCLEALQYLHSLGIIHCDLKPENILIKSYSRCEIKIIDLGSSCFHSDNLCLYVQSRSYRAPEVILGLPYDQKIDIWSLGCILAELLSGNVLFPNESLETLLGRIIGIRGPIDREILAMGQETHKYFTEDYDIYYRNKESGNVEYIIPQRSSIAQQLGYPDPEFVNFLEYLLETNPQRRPTAVEALQHPWLSCSYS